MIEMPKRVEVVDRVQDAHSKLLEGFSCTAVVAYLADTKGVSRRTHNALFNMLMP